MTDSQENRPHTKHPPATDWPTAVRSAAGRPSAQAAVEGEGLVRFYDESYAHEGEQANRYARWRALGAKGKANHVEKLCAQANIHPNSTLEVGCGDGALLSELHARGFGGELSGTEITEAAVRIASQRKEIASVERYDGTNLPAQAGTYDLGILSHVLEHVQDPADLLAETARVCSAVVAEVPLEDNLSARRGSKREHADEVGHLQRLSRESMRATVERAGLCVAGEIEDPLPLEVHRFFAETPATNALATAKWGTRRVLHALAPGLAKRVYTVHYACLCLPRT